MKDDKNRWSVYILRCADRSLYTGVTLDVERRFAEHQSGGAKAARYTRDRRPLELVFSSEIGKKGDAYRVETAIKQLSKRQKERLVRGEMTIEAVLDKLYGFKLRPINEDDRDKLPEVLEEAWGSQFIISKGHMIDASQLPGFVAEATAAKAGKKGEMVGLVTYNIDRDSCEVVTLNSFKRKVRGIGQILMEAVENEARQAGCTRLWLITTNDNTDALRFYQKRGFALCALHRDAIAESRKLQPSIPETGMYGIPLRDEIELEKLL